METPTSSSIIIVLVVMISVIVGFTIWNYYSFVTNVGSSSNVGAIVSVASDNAFKIYQTRLNNRKNLSTLLSSGLPESVRQNASLINFYVLTANMAGMFGPSKDGVYDTSAIEHAINAGARGFIFDIYAGSKKENYAPVLQVLQPGSNWKVQTMNTIPLGLALDSLRKFGFESGLSNSRQNDPMILYFRFRGTIYPSTLNLTASSIRATLEAYRVPTSENSNLVKQQIDTYNKKVIIFSNLTENPSKRTAFSDYINNLEGDERKNNYNPKDMIATVAESAVDNIVIQTKTTMAICAPYPEDDLASNNDWIVTNTNTSPIFSKGINMVGFNLFSFVNNQLDSALSDYLTDPNKFGVYSFWMKPDPLQYKVTLASPPTQNNLPRTDGTPRI
jgi:hypothetical protein